MKPDDEQLLDSVKKRIGEDAYSDFMRQKTTGLSVDVVDAFNTRTSFVPRFAIIGAMASIAIIAVMVISPFDTSDTAINTLGTPALVEMESNTDQLATGYLDDLVSDQTIESLIPNAKQVQSRTLLTEADIDALLKDL